MRPRIGITLELGAKGERRTNFLDLAYAKAVTAAGGLAAHFASIPSPEIIAESLGLVGGLVLTGGADIPPSFYREEINASVAIGPAERVEFDLRFFRAALKAGKPILAICPGMHSGMRTPHLPGAIENTENNPGNSSESPGRMDFRVP